MNIRIIPHLGFSPYEIRFGYQPAGPFISFSAPPARLKKRSLLASVDLLELVKAHPLKELRATIHRHIDRRATTHSTITERSERRKIVQKDRHDLGITKHLTFSPGDMVMLYDHSSAKKKLHASYRGPFIIAGPAGDYGTSYRLQQINGKAIPRFFYGDHLKPFRSRTGRLVNNSEQTILSFQNTRASKRSHKLPHGLDLGSGVWKQED